MGGGGREKESAREREAYVSFLKFLRWLHHARALEGVAKSQFPLKAVVLKRRYRVLTRFLYSWTPSCTLAGQVSGAGEALDDCVPEGAEMRSSSVERMWHT